MDVSWMKTEDGTGGDKEEDDMQGMWQLVSIERSEDSDGADGTDKTGIKGLCDFRTSPAEDHEQVPVPIGGKRREVSIKMEPDCTQVWANGQSENGDFSPCINGENGMHHEEGDWSAESGRCTITGECITWSRCNSDLCTRQKFQCASLDDRALQIIRNEFCRIQGFAMQKEWIARHIFAVSNPKDRGLRKGSLLHHLPSPSNPKVLMRVCRATFLAATGLSEWALRTILEHRDTSNSAHCGSRVHGKKLPLRIVININKPLGDFLEVPCHNCHSSIVLCFNQSEGKDLCPNKKDPPAVSNESENGAFQEPPESQGRVKDGQLFCPSEPHQRGRLVKKLRNCGESYFSEKSGKFVQGRRYRVMPKCTSRVCKQRNRECSRFNDATFERIRNDFYNLGQLSLQREWIARHISCQFNHRGSDRKKTILYYLPCAEDQLVEVCQVTFIAALGISQRQVRTVVQKLDQQTGALRGEMRGHNKKPDMEKRRKVEEHLMSVVMSLPDCQPAPNTSGVRYLPLGLTVSKLHRNFVAKFGRVVSSGTYRKVFDKLNFKVRKPKKSCTSSRKQGAWIKK